MARGVFSPHAGNVWIVQNAKEGGCAFVGITDFSINPLERIVRVYLSVNLTIVAVKHGGLDYAIETSIPDHYLLSQRPNINSLGPLHRDYAYVPEPSCNRSLDAKTADIIRRIEEEITSVSEHDVTQVYRYEVVTRTFVVESVQQEGFIGGHGSEDRHEVDMTNGRVLGPP